MEKKSVGPALPLEPQKEGTDADLGCYVETKERKIAKLKMAFQGCKARPKNGGPMWSFQI